MSTLTATRPADLVASLLSGSGHAPPAALSRLLPAGLGMSARLGMSAGLGMSAARAFAGPAGDDELFCPGAVRDDPALGDAVNERVVAWAEQIGIYPGRSDKLRAYNFGRFVMLTHPAANDVDLLLAAAKCLVAEWAADDYYVDEVSLGADPAQVGSRLHNLMAVIDPARMVPRYASGFDAHHRLLPISTAFRTALEHLSRYAKPAQTGRLQHQISLLFLASAQEADWRLNRRTPPVWEYLVQRQNNSYLPPMLLADVLGGYELSASDYYHPRVREAFVLAGNAATLVNDLYSAARESDGDFNLPAVLTAHEGLSRADAIRRTVEIHNDLTHRFVELAAPLSAAGSPPLRRFLADTWAWLGGSRRWHATTGRYQNRSGS